MHARAAICIFFNRKLSHAMKIMKNFQPETIARYKDNEKLPFGNEYSILIFYID